MGIKAMFDTERGYEELIDEYGDSWSIVADDGAGNMAVERDAGERWEAGTFDGSEIGPAREGSTFGVSCQDEFIVRQTDQAGSLRRFEND